MIGGGWIEKEEEEGGGGGGGGSTTSQMLLALAVPVGHMAPPDIFKPQHMSACLAHCAMYIIAHNSQHVLSTYCTSSAALYFMHNNFVSSNVYCTFL